MLFFNEIDRIKPRYLVSIAVVISKRGRRSRLPSAFRLQGRKHGCSRRRWYASGKKRLPRNRVQPEDHPGR